MFLPASLEHIGRKRQLHDVKQWTAQEFEATIKHNKNANYNEILHGGFTKPFFDSDAYYLETPENEHTVTRAHCDKSILDCFKSVLHNLLKHHRDLT